MGEYRAKWKLPPLHSAEASFSKLAQICQMPREFDFPRAELPACFHYVGPLRRALPEPILVSLGAVGWKTAVYASLGTLQNSREDVFRCIAEACRGLKVQLAINHVGGLSQPARTSNLPGDPLVVSSAPQLELLGPCPVDHYPRWTKYGARFADSRRAVW